MNSLLDLQPAPVDPQAALLAQLVARILAWPCPVCGQVGMCGCYAEPAHQPPSLDPPRPAAEHPDGR